jgi:hypothetical protein
MRLTAILFILFLAFRSAGISPGGIWGTYVSGTTSTPADGIRIAWDRSSLKKLAPFGQDNPGWAGYPRLRRLSDGQLLVVYETGGNVEMVRSDNNGLTWSSPEIIFKKHLATGENDLSTEVRKSNPELCQLHNGDLVIACNYRPVKAEITPFAIAVKRSSDNGTTWTESHVVYEAGPRFADGCWEPALLQLPGGELQIYFANEAPYTHSDEQEISMISSSDYGITWSEEVKTVSFRKNRRDGMPVPLIVDDEILVAIEDNKTDQFKPWIVRNPVSDNWKTIVTGDSPFREYALKERLPDSVYAGAPYIMRVPSGEVVLSYQTTSGRTTNWERSDMEVAVGDKTGRNFSKMTRPFDVPPDREAKWNSLSLWDENTIVAVATTSFQSRHPEVWMILGHIIPELKASRKTVTIDGNLLEWNENFPIFIANRRDANLSAALGYDDQNLTLAVMVNDNKLTSNTLNASGSQGVYVYIGTDIHNSTEAGQRPIKIWCSLRGDTNIFEMKNGIWSEIISGGLKSAVSERKGAYYIELAVPFSDFRRSDTSGIRINLGLKSTDPDGTIFMEHIVHADPSAPDSWMKVELLNEIR